MLKKFSLKIGGRDSQNVSILPEGVRERDGTYSDRKIYSWTEKKETSEILFLVLIFVKSEKEKTRKLAIRKEKMFLN